MKGYKIYHHQSEEPTRQEGEGLLGFDKTYPLDWYLIIQNGRNDGCKTGRKAEVENTCLAYCSSIYVKLLKLALAMFLCRLERETKDDDESLA